ncbi:MAG: hypothetical protein KF832_30735 [Caldilineaceae bacterium]|nr:hypothetical protein [Caldilineaceae bacterium]
MKHLPNFTNLHGWFKRLALQACVSLAITAALTSAPAFAAAGAAPLVTAHSATVDVVGAPCSVVPNTLEDDQLIRFFPERLNYPLPSAVTVTAPDGSKQVIPQGTLVNSYYVHADWRNNGKNQPKTFAGSVTFAQPAYGVIKDTAELINSHGLLGAPGTAYSASVDQGQEGYGDKIWFSDNGQTLNLHFTVYNIADQVRVLTAASPAVQTSGPVEMSGAPCSVVEGTLESDSTIRLFPERLNYVLPESLTLDAQGAPGLVIPQGTAVNVYYVHADRVGDQQGVVKKLVGAVSFDKQVLAVLTNGAALQATHGTLGNTQNLAIQTAYSGNVDQGLDAGDMVTVSPNRVDFAFDVWNVADQIRIITLAN